MHKKIIKRNFMTPLDPLFHVTTTIQYRNVFYYVGGKDAGLL